MAVITNEISNPKVTQELKYWELEIKDNKVVGQDISKFRLFNFTPTTLEAISSRELARKLQADSIPKMIGIDSLTLLKVWKDATALDTLRQICSGLSIDVVACIGQFTKGKFIVSEPHYQQVRRKII